MKILHVIWALNIGGAESMLVDIINEQSKTEEVHLVIVNNIVGKSLLRNIHKKISVYKINRIPGSKNPFYPLYLNIILFSLRPEVIHFHNHDLIKMILFKKILRAKSCLTVHDTRIPDTNFNKYDQVFAISSSVKNDINERSKIDVKTVYNGINIDLIKQKTDFNYINFKIVQVGRLDHETKGQHVILNALCILTKNYKIKNISIDFIGDGLSKGYLEDLIEELGIKQFCHFLGVKDRQYVYENLSAYNLLIQPSLYEGFGLTVAEAMAARLPVLVSDIEGPMEIIKKGEYGYFFKTDDSCACADEIMKIMQHYGSERFMDKINQGYEYICENFSLRDTAKKYINYYNSMLST